MPIEIKQLEIRGKVFSTENTTVADRKHQYDFDKMKREIIESCLEKFERYLENKKDR